MEQRNNTKMCFVLRVPREQPKWEEAIIETFNMNSLVSPVISGTMTSCTWLEMLTACTASLQAHSAVMMPPDRERGMKHEVEEDCGMG